MSPAARNPRRPTPDTPRARQLGRVLPILLFILALSAGQIGCSPGDDKHARLLASCAKAEAAKQSDFEGLRAELDAIERQGGLPWQLERPRLPANLNAAAALPELLDAPLRSALNEPLARLSGRDRFAFSEQERADAAQLIERHAQRVDRLREAAASPRAQFPLGTHLGYFAKVAYLDDAAIACRFELASAAVALDASPADALPPLERCARWIGWLADEPRLEPRLLAAGLRHEWLRAAEAVAANPAATLADYGRLRGVLVGWLAGWPDPAAALAGDRAAALHAYEAIRHGQLKKIATSGEWDRLEAHGVTADNPPSGEALDRDLLSYLTAMRRLIELVREPYYRRHGQHKDVATMLTAGAVVNETAPLAREMFLPGLPAALETLAVDRAACEAWALALSSAGGFKLPEHRINPHNGELYRVDRMPRTLIVETEDAAIRNPFALRRTR